MSAVANDSPDGACHPMMSFSGKTRSSTIFSRSFSITVDILQVSSGLGNGTDSLGEDVAAEATARALSGRAKAPMAAKSLNTAAARHVRGEKVLRRQI